MTPQAGILIDTFVPVYRMPWPEPDELARLSDEVKSNDCHDEDGRFCTTGGGGAQSIGLGGVEMTEERIAQLKELGEQNKLAASIRHTDPFIQRAVVALEARQKKHDKDLEKVRKAVLKKEAAINKKWEEHSAAHKELTALGKSTDAS